MLCIQVAASLRIAVEIVPRRTNLM